MHRKGFKTNSSSWSNSVHLLVRLTIIAKENSAKLRITTPAPSVVRSVARYTKNTPISIQKIGRLIVINRSHTPGTLLIIKMAANKSNSAVAIESKA